jgi:hypothetical protein
MVLCGLYEVLKMTNLGRNFYEGKAQEPSSKLSVLSETGDIQSLLIAIFQAAHSIFTETDKPIIEYLNSCASDINKLGRILKFLGLAEDSAQSAFGWKPTAELIQIIAERAARPTKASKTQASKMERRFVDSLIQLAGGQTEEPFTDDFLFNVLNGLGLLQESDTGVKPTARLREVVTTMFEP